MRIRSVPKDVLYLKYLITPDASPSRFTWGHRLDCVSINITEFEAADEKVKSEVADYFTPGNFKTDKAVITAAKKLSIRAKMAILCEGFKHHLAIQNAEDKYSDANQELTWKVGIVVKVSYQLLERYFQEYRPSRVQLFFQRLMDTKVSKYDWMQLTKEEKFTIVNDETVVNDGMVQARFVTFIDDIEDELPRTLIRKIKTNDQYYHYKNKGCVIRASCLVKPPKPDLFIYPNKPREINIKRILTLATKDTLTGKLTTA